MVHPGCNDAAGVGNVDARSVVDQINKTFGELKANVKHRLRCRRFLRCVRKREYYDRRGASGPVIYHVGYAWQPIRESAALLRYWRADLARRRCSGMFSKR